ncbi:MAG: hypothetical protein IBV52_01145 [Candidatus Bathyarchaeota archaeon]
MQLQSDTIDLDELRPIMRYIEVLVAEYPNPLSNKELAEKAGVSRASISKQKRRIRSLCNVDELVYNTRMVLKSDPVIFMKIAFLFFSEGTLNKFFSSPSYLLGVLGRTNIHEELSKSIDEYSRHFTKQDTENLILIILKSLSKLKISNIIREKVSDPEQRAILLSFNYAQAFGDFLNNLDLPLDTNKDLKLLLRMRDKLFYLAKDVCRRLVENVSILKSLPNNKKSRYFEVYLETIDFYLRKYFNSGTTYIKKVAERKDIPFKNTYTEIGYFYNAKLAS